MKDIWESLPEWAIKDERKKYIFGSDADSMSIFLMTLTENVYVTAFIQNEYEQTDPRTSNNSMFNKKIISFDNAENNSIVFCSDDLENIDLIEKQAKENNCRLCRIGVQKIANDILNNDVVIYGTANRGKATLKFLRENGVNVIGFADSDKSKTGSKVEDLEVIDFDEINKDTVIIISSGFYKEIFNKICKSGLRVFIDYRQIYYAQYYPYIIIKSEIQKYDILWHCNVQFLNFMVHVMDKKIIIDGYNDFGKDFIRILKLMDKTIEYCVDDEVFEIEGGNIEVKSKYDLIYEDMSDKMVIVTKLDVNLDVCTICPESIFLEELGLEKEKDYRILNTMHGYTVYPKSMMNNNYVRRVSAYDPLLIYTKIYPETDKNYMQYVVHGNPDSSKIRIMTIGGSTTDGGDFQPIKSWSQYLFEKQPDDVVVFNGGISGYNSGQECLKLMRDIEMINPDIVISYSGINDTWIYVYDKHPLTNKGYIGYLKIEEQDVDMGIDNNESVSSFWLRMQKTMKAICEIHGCKFIGILQPAIYRKKFLTEKEKMTYTYCTDKQIFGYPYSLSDYIKIYENLLEVLEFKDFMEDDSLYDFTRIFENHIDEIFMDECHVYEKGNEIIAEKIYSILKEKKYIS